MKAKRQRKPDEGGKCPVAFAFNSMAVALALWCLLFLLLPGATADGETGPTSTIDIIEVWYSSESSFDWTADGDGNNLSSLEIWYQYKPLGGNLSDWQYHSTLQLDGEDSGDFPFNFPDGVGYYTLESNASDSSNASEFISSEDFTGEEIRFDDVKPTSSTTLASGTRTTSGNIDISWEASDNFDLDTVRLEYSYRPAITAASGSWTPFQTKDTSGTNDNGDFTSFPFPEGEGRYDFRIIARDHVNEEEPPPGQDAYIILDLTPAEGEIDYSGDYWVTGNTSIPWSASDNYDLFNVELRYSYRPDNSSGFGSWIPFHASAVTTGNNATGTFTFELLEGQGIYNLWIVCNDNAGNSGPDLDVGQSDLSLGYDTGTPSGDIIYNGDFWRNSETTIQYSAQDNIDVGEVELYYRFKTDNNSAYSDYIYAETYATTGGKVTNGIMKTNGLSGSGLYQFHVKLADSAGNIWTSPDSDFIIGFDMETPSVFILNVVTEGSYIFYREGVLYYNGQIIGANAEATISGYSADYLSGVAGDTEFTSTFNLPEVESEGNPWSAIFVFPPFTTGSQTISITSTDSAGNKGSIDIPVVEDTNPPETSIAMSVNGVVNETSPISIDVNTEYMLTSYDTVAGVKFIEYRFDGGEWQNYTVPFRFEPKTQSIGYRAVDNLGNEETIQTLVVELLNIRPTATIWSPMNSSVEVIQGENITFEGLGEDLDGDIEAYEWHSNVDGFLSNETFFMISNLSIGTHTITFGVMDDMGVWSSNATVTVEVTVVDAAVSEESLFEKYPWYLWLAFFVGIIGVGYATYITVNRRQEVTGEAEDEIVTTTPSLLTECSSCGGPIGEGVKYCKGCGHQIAKPEEQSTSVVLCTNCGNAIPASRKFCRQCGTPAPEELKTEEDIASVVTCINCGNAIPVSRKFCRSCGTPSPEESRTEETGVCTGCGATLSKDKKFCAKCGKSVA